MNPRAITAPSLRLILSISLFVITAIAGAVIYVANHELSKVATEVSHTVVDANASQDNLQTLQELQRELADNQDIVNRTSNVVANSQSYQYQNQIINDLNAYAKRAGITLTNIDFSTSGSKSSSSSSSSQAAGPANTVPAPSGVKPASISVSLKSPVSYNKLIRFMRSIEQNLTKMQISNIHLTQGEGGGVSSDVLNIQVYVR